MKKTIFDDDTLCWLRKIYTLECLEFAMSSRFTSFVDDCIVVVADVVVVVFEVVSMAAASFCCFVVAADGESPEPGGCDGCCCCCCWFSGDAVSALTIIAIFGLF